VTGFPKDPDKFSRALAGCLAELMANPVLCKRMGEAGRRRVEETFAWEAIAKQTVKLYQTLVKK
jgi:starch synthase